jgi:hypothetical protein
MKAATVICERMNHSTESAGSTAARTPRRAGRSSTLLALACCIGCGGEGFFGSERIVNGSVDTTHQAVVAYLFGNAHCTATIVHTEGNDGYALTAGDCFGQDFGSIRQGDTFNAGYVSYPVVDRTIHPSFPSCNFGLLRFNGATAATPTMPIASPDDDPLAVGLDATIVGYGLTENGATYQRHASTVSVSLLTDQTVTLDQSSAGFCHGDNGGPLLVDVGGVPHVAGVASHIEGGGLDCIGPGVEGVAGRASAILETFVLPAIAGMPLEEGCALPDDPPMGSSSDSSGTDDGGATGTTEGSTSGSTGSSDTTDSESTGASTEGTTTSQPSDEDGTESETRGGSADTSPVDDDGVTSSHGDTEPLAAPTENGCGCSTPAGGTILWLPLLPLFGRRRHTKRAPDLVAGVQRPRKAGGLDTRAYD